jgi:hypothetical protein
MVAGLPVGKQFLVAKAGEGKLIDTRFQDYWVAEDDDEDFDLLFDEEINERYSK